MLEKRTTVHLIGETQRAYASRILEGIQQGATVIFAPESRTLAQNRKLWPMLRDVSEQVEWHGRYLTNENWKDMFTAALRKLDTVPGIDGGLVVLGLHTSRMGKREFCDLVELIYAFGAERGVTWSELASIEFADIGVSQ